MWRGILGLAFLWTVGGDFTIKEPWHVLNIDSHRLNLSLTSSSLTVAQKLCPELKEYELEDCIALVMQSHRTIRQSYLDTMATEIGLRSMEFSRLLAYSYAIESCPDDDESPLDICFFGEVSPLVLIFTLLSCERYHLKIFNVFDTESELALIFLRQLYPNRSIQWITGHSCLLSALSDL